MSAVTGLPVAHTDPVNARILSVSEDRVQGFVRDPFATIAAMAELDVDTVIERIRAMLRAGTIRRVRQTLMATKHLASAGIPLLYTNVFWGGRSEIKPSEISPFAYREWCANMGIDPETMRE